MVRAPALPPSLCAPLPHLQRLTLGHPRFSDSSLDSATATFGACRFTVTAGGLPPRLVCAMQSKKQAHVVCFDAAGSWKPLAYADLGNVGLSEMATSANGRYASVGDLEGRVSVLRLPDLRVSAHTERKGRGCARGAEGRAPAAADLFSLPCLLPADGQKQGPRHLCHWRLFFARGRGRRVGMATGRLWLCARSVGSGSR